MSPPVHISFQPPMKCPSCAQEVRAYDPTCDWCDKRFHPKCGLVTEHVALCNPCRDLSTGGNR